MKALSTTLLIALGLVLWACQHTKETALAPVAPVPAIAPPFAEMDQSFEHHNVLGDQATSLYPGNQGTVLHIPANAFVDQEGQPYSGLVDIQYREFRTLGEIIASGIKMTYEKDGESNQFQSAGMFEFRPFGEGQEPLEIAPGKSIDIEMRSDQPEEDYSFFGLDEEVANWDFLADAPAEQLTDEAIEAAADAAFLATAPEAPLPVLPVQPNAYDPSKYTFDLDVNYGFFPELKYMNGIMWQYAGTTAEQDPINRPELQGEDWTSVKLENTDEAGVYSLYLKNKKVNWKTTVIPVLRGKALEQAEANFDEAMTAYETARANRLDERTRRQQQRQVFSSMMRQNQYSRKASFRTVGVFNYDRIIHFSNRVELAVDIRIDGEEVDLEDVDFYQITFDKKVAIMHSAPEFYRFAYLPEEENFLIAVLPDDRVAICRNDQFAAIDWEFVPEGELVDHEFQLETVEKKFTTATGLDGLLADL